MNCYFVRAVKTIEAPCTKVQGIFQARKGFICCSSLANPRSKLRGMRSLFLFNKKTPSEIPTDQGFRQIKSHLNLQVVLSSVNHRT